jgi:hypothetical protein
MLPYGGICAVGTTCPVDRCTYCTCRADLGLMCASRCTDAGTPDGATPIACRSGADCPSSMMCDGPAGCGMPWSCVAARPCTADVSPFCGCDGNTFYGSSSCPGQPYQVRAACPGDAGTVSCAPQDARGEGLCDGFFGYAWNGSTCAAITGCRCVGADCPSLSRDPDACRMRYIPCA